MYCYTCEKDSRAREDNPQQAHGMASFIFAIEDIMGHDIRHNFESLQGYYEAKMQAELAERCSSIVREIE